MTLDSHVTRPQWTPEPWEYRDKGRAGYIFGSPIEEWRKDDAIAGVLLQRRTVDEADANAERIVQCVNACSPNGPVAALVQAAEAMVSAVGVGPSALALEHAIQSVREALQIKG